MRATIRTTTRMGRRLTAGLAAASLLASLATPVPALAALMRVTDRAHLRLIGSHENTLVEAGRATGTLPGGVRVQFTVHGVHARSRFTIYAKGGRIDGVATGIVKSGKAGYDSFGGRLRLTGGSGRYRGAHGRGGLYGSLYKLNQSISVKVNGTLHYR